jgi:hypothetical protein
VEFGKGENVKSETEKLKYQLNEKCFSMAIAHCHPNEKCQKCKL